MALSVRLARGFGGFHRQLARGLLDEQIEDPEPFVSRPGFLGWLQSSLRDRTGWRSMAYVAVKVPLAVLGILVGFAAWWDAFFCLTYPLWGRAGGHVPVFGLPELFFGPGLFSAGQSGFWHGLGVFCAGIVLFFAAPMVRPRGGVPRPSCHAGAPRSRCPGGAGAGAGAGPGAIGRLVGGDAAADRARSARRHPGPTGRAGHAARDGQGEAGCDRGRAGRRSGEHEIELDHVRQLVDDAHRGAKEAIVELRDLARGIHPPALDVGLEGALSTLAARSTIPTELTVSLHDRPTPAIEAIAYFCVAELLANVAQHAHASQASITCTDYGQWLRVVVRDDGTGGAELSRIGSRSSGLVGLTDRVHAVDGRLDIASPPRGPTVVTVDLPLHA